MLRLKKEYPEVENNLGSYRSLKRKLQGYEMGREKKGGETHTDLAPTVLGISRREWGNWRFWR